MACNCTCNFNTDSTTTSVESISWAQITPLLMNADRVYFEKSKIDSKGIVTKDSRTWALVKIEWGFNPLAESSSTFTIKPLDDSKKEQETTEQPPQEQGSADGVAVAVDVGADTETESGDVEIFDFLSGIFKLYYDSKSETIFGEIETIEAGLSVVYRYIFHFFGMQKVSYSDLLTFRDAEQKPTSALVDKGSVINRVIAL